MKYVWNDLKPWWWGRGIYRVGDKIYFFKKGFFSPNGQKRLIFSSNSRIRIQMDRSGGNTSLPPTDSNGDGSADGTARPSPNADVTTSSGQAATLPPTRPATSAHVGGSALEVCATAPH
jgi:hypothetical protein